MTVHLLRGDARAIPLAAGTVDCIVTSPPYYGQRDYDDDGQPLAGQIGAEDDPAQYLAALWECTAEWLRVLTPGGNLFVNLGDKRSDRANGEFDGSSDRLVGRGAKPYRPSSTGWARRKSLMLLPEAYALGVTGALAVLGGPDTGCRAILRQRITWEKANPMPESQGERTKDDTEQVLHFTRNPRHYSATDTIREPYADDTPKKYASGRGIGRSTATVAASRTGYGDDFVTNTNPLGKIPGSVWRIPTEPLRLPAAVARHIPRHTAAFPTELVRRLLSGWCPYVVCRGCGEGRFPAVADELVLSPTARRLVAGGIGAWVCSCCPTEIVERAEASRSWTAAGTGERAPTPTGRQHTERRRAPRLIYRIDRWTVPAGRPARVLDPFGGTGTTALVADVTGRVGLTLDRSGGYTRTARWRTTDPGQRAKAGQRPAPTSAALRRAPSIAAPTLFA